MNDTVTVEGKYFDGLQPMAVPAKGFFSEGEVAFSTPEISKRYDIRQLRVSPRIAQADRFIVMPNGGQFQCPDGPFLDSLPQEGQVEGLVAWLEGRWGVALAGVLITVALLLSVYFYGLPVAAESVAAKIPIDSEQNVGRQSLLWLDQHKWFEPSRLNQDRRKPIQESFNGLISGLPLERYYRLEFRDSTSIGPNALALPGGTIVITDAMVKATESPEEVLAVLAHEIGHVEMRHTIRHLLQNSVVGVAVATITTDAASLSAAVAGLPALLAQTKYSREFETEADEFAFKLLRQRGYSPNAFADLMERLSKKESNSRGNFDFLSTHPVTSERVKRARAAAGH